MLLGISPPFQRGFLWEVKQLRVLAGPIPRGATIIHHGHPAAAARQIFASANLIYHPQLNLVLVARKLHLHLGVISVGWEGSSQTH